MEARFGHSFADVRVHTDEAAARSAEAIQAHAYTFGRHVVMGAGRWQPHTPAGQKLLAHELTHVVQQSGSNSSPSQATSISNPHDPAEHEAVAKSHHIGGIGRPEVMPSDPEVARAAVMIASSDRSPLAAGASVPAVAREADEEDLDAGIAAVAPAISSSAGEAASGAAGGAGEAANPPGEIEYTTQGPQPTDAGQVGDAGLPSPLGTGAATGGAEITLETGNVGASPINNAVHQQVCVSTGTDAGKQCFSFAANGSLQAPEFSTTWLGWSSIVAGAILNGEVYHPGPVPGATIVGRHTPTAAQAARWLNYMRGRRLGLQDGYSVARHNCRTFSQWEFRDAPSHW
jgi:hypothetical protein